MNKFVLFDTVPHR